MADKAYWELLRDPRWQRKRLEVMQRENFACEWCGSKEKTLNVHHGYYAKGHMPWEYESETLHCLCEECHAVIQNAQNEIKPLLAKLSVCLIPEIKAYLEAILASDNGGILRIASDETSAMIGVGEFLGLHPAIISEMLQANKFKLTGQDIASLRKEEDQRRDRQWKSTWKEPEWEAGLLAGAV